MTLSDTFSFRAITTREDAHRLLKALGLTDRTGSHEPWGREYWRREDFMLEAEVSLNGKEKTVLLVIGPV